MSEPTSPGWGEHQTPWGTGPEPARSAFDPPDAPATTAAGAQPGPHVEEEITYTVRRVRLSGSERKIATIVGALAVVGLGVGVFFLLSGDDEPTAAPTTTAAAKTTTTAEPGTVTAAQAKYFELAGNANKALAAIDKSATDFASATAACSSAAEVNTAFASGLRGWKGWGDAADEVEALAKATEQQAAAETACGKAADEAALPALRAAVNTAEAATAELATKAREALGLPPDRR